VDLREIALRALESALTGKKIRLCL